VNRLVRACLCVALCALALAAPAGAHLSGFPFYNDANVEGRTPPRGNGFEGPCGLAVDSQGDFYVGDYHHDQVSVFHSSREGLARLSTGGPCGLAIGGTGSGTTGDGDLYVNRYHGTVARYVPSAFPLVSMLPYGPGAAIDPGPATGVAVDPLTGNVYVDRRTYVAVYEPSGAPVEAGGEPLRIGAGSLADGYGVAVSVNAATAGYVYVPDAASGTVRVYDPASDPAVPVEEIDAHEVPGGGFVSLRDSAVAVDRVSGRVYVADDLAPEYSELPPLAVYAFESGGEYAGHLPEEEPANPRLVDALPPGLAVGGGRVYVTSGNTAGASVVAYGTGELSKGPLPAAAGEGAAASAAATAPPPRDSAESPAAAAPSPPASASETVQRGGLRVALRGGLAPNRLPRRGRAPVSVSLGGRISEAGGGSPPQLRGLRIEFNRHGSLDTRGLPRCPPARIQPATTARALLACRDALVGRGSFSADVVLSGQAPYATGGTLLVFNGRAHGRPALLGQIYAAKPFATSFLIPFTIGHTRRGRWGTVLEARLPRALGSWGHITSIDLKLGRGYAYRGRRHSVLSAGCPAPAGFPGVLFPLARMSFSFVGGPRLSSTLTRSCRVR
jgi:NHL repeat